MTSVLAPTHPTAVPTAGQHHLVTSKADPAMQNVQEPTPPHQVKQEDESDRGRRRSRTVDDDDDMGMDTKREQAGDGDPNPANSSASDAGPARKRRRSRKGLDKKFECPHDGCGKSYSRAEHLYRHQLNHTPKQIYYCGVGDCTRSFVRLDLCNRHKDRHAAKGSALNRKDRDSMMGHGGSPLTSPVAGAFHPGSVSPEANRPGSGYPNLKAVPPHMQYSPKDGPYTPMTNTPPTGYPSAGPTPNGMDYMTQHDQQAYAMLQGPRQPHQSPPGPHRPTVQTDVAVPFGVLSPVSTAHGGYHSHHNNTPQSSTVFVGAQNFPPFSLPPSNFNPAASPVVPREMTQTYPPGPPSQADYQEQAAVPQQRASEMMMLDQMAIPNAMPIFGSSDVLQKSPYVGMPEDFMAYLFNSNSSQQGDSPLGQIIPQPGARYNNYGEFANQYGVPYYASASDPSQVGYFPPAPQQVMSVTSLLDQGLPEAIISDEKCNEIFEIVRDRFHETGAPVERQKEHIVEGNRSDDTHMLSRKMMQAYIMSYWVHFSDQVPILHKPTFSPDRTPNLLLIAMMTIGAACLDKAHGVKVVRAGAQLSNFLAWHLRWEIFMDPAFRPPAKLWVFQTMLLLELYEKMYSTRELHERAHIHHATTITLMRRGRSLMGKSTLDSPPNARENGSRQSSTSAAHTPDDWWDRWITNEATRRVAFAAFLIDSVHATMFGHSTVMVAHEMRLPLPCDEKLWKAASGAEVNRIEANLYAQGIKPLMFLEALKRTLSNQEVNTNAFGRTILMAGLLSVSWHMNQRDLQVNSLGGGMSQALGGRDKWRGTLTRAFDLWRANFDKALKQGSSDVYRCYEPDKMAEANVVFESRTVLHHLAHMAMHVDIVDCQIYARAKRLLGRAIGTSDLNNAQRRMKDIWAPSAKARDAAYYALKFLSSVLMPKWGDRSSALSDMSSAAPTPASSTHSPSSSSNGYLGGPAAAAAAAVSSPANVDEPYSARDDVLLNRPWVLYFAALVVWCYGYALEGPCPNYAPPPTKGEQILQMQEYLTTYGGVVTPEELKGKRGMNNNSALLMVLKDAFENTRWELLHEGATLLSNCIQLNAGASAP